MIPVADEVPRVRIEFYAFDERKVALLCLGHEVGLEFLVADFIDEFGDFAFDTDDADCLAVNIIISEHVSCIREFHER